MGAIAAAFDKQGADAISLVSTMLEEMKHRGTKTPLIVGQPRAFISHFLNSINSEKASSKVAVGTISAEPVIGENYAWVLEGRFYPPPQQSFVHYMRDNLTSQPKKVCSRILRELNGAYIFAVVFQDRILVGRDPTGTVPLYVGENESISAVASERKALWKIGITNTKSFAPGNLALLHEARVTSELVTRLEPLHLKKVEMYQAAKHLRKVLETATQERLSDVKRVCVAFSGGLDSSVIASLAKSSGVSVHLIYVGLAGQSEVEQAKQAAQILGLPLKVQTYRIADVERILPKVLWLIEEPSVLKVGVAIPFFWTAEIASELGCRVLLAGQGADELFGGYRRYLTVYARDGADRVQQAMDHDVAMSYETNLQRDEPVCAYHKIELRLPFVDSRVTCYALSLPLELKIKSADDTRRKRVLRQVAQDVGIPAFIAHRPKKAVQFTTGVDKALEKIAKRENLTKHVYIQNAFLEVFETGR